MNINDAFPSKYLRESDLGGNEVIVTMAHVSMEVLGQEKLPVVYFVGKDKGLVLNKTNGNTIADLYGPETDAWPNKPITLFPTHTEYQGKMTPCIRVKPSKPTQNGSAPANATTDEEPAYVPF